jgi:hypothetical protein
VWRWRVENGWIAFKERFSRVRTWVVGFICLMSFVVPTWVVPHLQHKPPVGVYIAVMGLAVALMTLPKEPNGLEKFLWTVTITILMVAEITNLYKTDEVQAGIFSKITGDLDLTAQRLQTTAEGLRQTASEIRTLHLETTGGDSLFYLEPSDTTIVNGTVYFMLLPQVKGQYPLRDVEYDFFSPLKGHTTARVGTIYPNPVGRGYVTPNVEFPDDSSKEFLFQVVIAASNGVYFEPIRFRKINGKWIHALKLESYTYPERTVFLTEIQRNFGTVDWSKP